MPRHLSICVDLHEIAQSCVGLHRFANQDHDARAIA